MKPPIFDYQDPRTIDEALDGLATAQGDTAVLAGGQSLVPLLNMRLSRPDLVIDINSIAELDNIVVTPEAVTLGATARLSTIEHDPQVKRALPVLADASQLVAHPQIRNRTTIGGTLCHADPAAELPSVAVALDARLRLQSRSASRTVQAGEFFESFFTTTKNPDELLVAVDFPRRDGLITKYDEVSRRQGDFPFVGLCLGIRTDDGIAAEVRAAAAGIADHPVRLTALEQALLGRSPAAAMDDAVEAASSEITPPTDQHGTAEYRRGLLRTLVRRIINTFEEGSA